MNGPALTADEGIEVALDALDERFREVSAELDTMQERVSRLAFASRLAATGWDEAALRQLRVACA